MAEPIELEGLRTLTLNRRGALATITIDHPPINLLDQAMLDDLERCVAWLECDRTSNVCVLQSAHPAFFVAHYDVELLLREGPRRTIGPGDFNLLMERLRHLPQLTVGKIEGIARGGGSELLLALDLRYAELERTVVGQPEVALGIIPGGGATQRLPALVGRSRALEMIVGGGDLDAEVAERYGYVTRALPADRLGGFVDDLARRVASFPRAAVTAAKAAVNASECRAGDGFAAEAAAFAAVRDSTEAQRRMSRFLSLGGQTDDVERRLPDIYGALAAP